MTIKKKTIRIGKFFMEETRLKVDFIYLSDAERRLFAESTQLIWIDQVIDDREQNRQNRREWARIFWTRIEVCCASTSPIAEFFDKCPGLRKLVGTKILLFSGFSSAIHNIKLNGIYKQ